MAQRPSFLAVLSAQRLPEDALRETVSLTVGEYYVVALDDIVLQSQFGEPGVLERLVPFATRVAVSEGAPRDVLLQRRSRSDLK